MTRPRAIKNVGNTATAIHQCDLPVYAAQAANPRASVEMAGTVSAPTRTAKVSASTILLAVFSRQCCSRSAMIMIRPGNVLSTSAYLAIIVGGGTSPLVDSSR